MGRWGDGESETGGAAEAAIADSPFLHLPASRIPTGTSTCFNFSCIVPQFAAVAHVDRVAFAAFDGAVHGHAADGGFDLHEHVLDVQTVAGDLGTVRDDVEGVAARDAFGIGAAGARDLLDHALELFADVVDRRQVGTEIFTPTGVRMPVLSMSMRALMGMVQALTWPGRVSASSISATSSSQLNGRTSGQTRRSPERARPAPRRTTSAVAGRIARPRAG